MLAMVGASPIPPVCVTRCRMASVSAGPWNVMSGSRSTTRSSSERRPSSASAIVHMPTMVLVIEPIRCLRAGS